MGGQWHWDLVWLCADLLLQVASVSICTLATQCLTVTTPLAEEELSTLMLVWFLCAIDINCQCDGELSKASGFSLTARNPIT